LILRRVAEQRRPRLPVVAIETAKVDSAGGGSAHSAERQRLRYPLTGMRREPYHMSGALDGKT